MIIFFGMRSLKSDLGFKGLPMNCPKCGKTYKKRYIKDQYWIHLFYVPIIPIGSDYYRLCPVCNSGVKYADNSEAKSDMATSVIYNQDLVYFYYEDKSVKPNLISFWLKDEITGEIYTILKNVTWGQYKKELRARFLKHSQVKRSSTPLM